MRIFVEYGFRFIMYVLFGLSLEVIFSVVGINLVLGYKVKTRVPKRYLEGYVSLFMIPIHGLGILFIFENVYAFAGGWFIVLRYLLWCVLFTVAEVLGGLFYNKILGYYPWDYYKESKYKVFKNGYTLWTLIPLWGIAGLILELYTKIMIFASSYIAELV